MEEDKLKLCPFCGTQGYVFRIKDVDDPNFGGIGICCETEGCAQVGLRWACGDDPTDQLISLWNARK